MVATRNIVVKKVSQQCHRQNIYKIFLIVFIGINYFVVGTSEARKKTKRVLIKCDVCVKYFCLQCYSSKHNTKSK